MPCTSMSRRRGLGSYDPAKSRYETCACVSAVFGSRLRTFSARWMSCFTPGPALLITRIVPGMPPRLGEPIPTPALPSTINCWVSLSHQIVARSASISSRVRNSLARSQMSGGSVTCASQSKVGKSLVIGSKVWIGMGCSLSASGGRLVVLQPALRLRDGVVSREDGVDLSQLLGRELPSEGAEILLDLLRPAEAHERGRDRLVADSPGERELRQGLAMAGRDALQLLHRREVLREMIGTEHGAEEVQASQGAALRAPVVLVEGHDRVERA